MVRKEPFIAPDAVASHRPQVVEASFGVKSAIAARKALNLGILDSGEATRDSAAVLHDFLSMLIDAAKRNDGSFVEIKAQVL